MTDMHDSSSEQQRWNEYGIKRIREIESNPDKYLITDCPKKRLEAFDELMSLLTPIGCKKVLELGCGRGDFSIWMAKQGAQVTAIDVGFDLVSAARALSKINKVECDILQGSIANMPLQSSVYDVVIGLNVLHHLGESDLLKAFHEVHRVLKDDGAAIFYEPVENSKFFDFMQKLIPVGDRLKENYRPSILQRKKWAKHMKMKDDRSLTNRELISAGKGLFRDIKISHYGFLIRLSRVIGEKHRGTLLTIDRVLFRILPFLRFYSQKILAVYRGKL